MGLAKRRLYKPERAPARTKGVLKNEHMAPISLLNANATEIALALFALGQEAGVIVGRGCEYDNLRDEYTVLGKSRETGKVQDFRVKGQEVADLIRVARVLNGGPMKRKQLVA